MSSSTSSGAFDTINSIETSGGDDFQKSSKKQRLIHGKKDDDHSLLVAVDHEEDRKARELLRKIGFDREDMNKECRIVHDFDDGNDGGGGFWSVTPMIYFSGNGNLKMCKYLFSRGADCRKKFGWTYPFFSAAANGHFEVIKWLFHHGGAKDDIQNQSTSGHIGSPLFIALKNGHEKLVKWLIRNGALSRDGAIIDDMTMRNDLCEDYYEKWNCDKRLNLLSWAQDAVTIHDHFGLFLKGTIISSSSFRRHPNNDYETRSKRKEMVSATTSSPLVMFKGKSGILELIAEYVGIPKAQEVRTFRQLSILLPAFIEDVPFTQIEEGEEQEDGLMWELVNKNKR
mmetsp:Transcript_32990/g.38005  ORF Transcript_32990/g.38005 Transcript_32990/m.38005 type:complete len:341 (+) Transcript_32990:56-1078(+)